MKQKKMIFSLGVVLAALAFLVYSGIQDTMVYYLTPSELLAKVQTGALAQDEGLRVSGLIIPESVKWDPQKFQLTFKMTDGSATFSGMYNNVAPDNFVGSEDVILEGTYKPDGHFMATKVMVKCPSKYDTQDKNADSN